jgi:hypothetical protein
VQCTTPYPAYVKESIRQIVQRVKRSFPDNFVKVHVDTRDMVFLVSRKPPDDDPDPGWKYRIGDIPIPREAMDVYCRRVPKDWVLPIPPSKENETTPYRNTRKPEPASSVRPNDSGSPTRATSSMETDNGE